MTSDFLLLAAGSNAALIAFAIYTLLVMCLAVIAARWQTPGGFLSEFFLGSRGLGVWAFALTFAATSASGGSFTGFPSKIYSHGWILALWIGSYMLVPVFTMALLGKRLNQMARQSGAITIPDVLRARFNSSAFGIVATLLIIFFMAFNLVAQFKAGALILATLLDHVPLFDQAVLATSRLTDGLPGFTTVDPAYLLCLVCFALAVIVYTSYGGFRAVVWTDVLQGVVMLFGVMIMLPLALSQVGGLANATDKMARMTPPQTHEAVLSVEDQSDSERAIPLGTWIVQPATATDQRRVFRTAQRSTIAAGEQTAKVRNAEGERIRFVPILEVTTPEVRQEFQPPAPPFPISVQIESTLPYAYGANTPGVYVSGPGPSPSDAAGFLPLSIAISFFFFWVFAATGQPSNMVRLMAFKDSNTLRKAILTVAIYYSLIYFPLVVIFCCARILLPGMEVESDRIMPAMAEQLTSAAGWPWLAGLLVAAPFAAVMSTVDSFLLMISSALVRDVYQREINPEATEPTLRKMTYTVTAVVGCAALLGALNPPAYLQDIIVFTGGGLAACFLVPVALGVFWPRFNASGALASMLGGFLTHSLLYGIGKYQTGRLEPVKLAGFDPFLPEVLVSLIAAVGITLLTKPPEKKLIAKFF